MLCEDASPKDNGSLERAVQELEALESIYGYEPGGFTVHSVTELALARSVVGVGQETGAEGAEWSPPQLELEICVNLGSGEENGAVARLRCTMPPGYPTTASVQVSVSVDGFRRAQQDKLTLMLQQKADELLGDESVVDLVQALEELYSGVGSEGSAQTQGGLPEPELEQPDLLTTLFRIDHMNDSTAYIRKLKLWSDELDLGIVLLYRMRSKSVNASSGGKAVSPKGRAEDIWVLMEGTRDHASEFLSRLRTHKMTGQDRHERKSTVVWDSNSANESTSKRRIADKFIAQEYR